MPDSRRRSVLPWRRNADELEMEGTGNENFLNINFVPIFFTADIEEFLNIDGSDRKRVLVAGKGLGKTLLLKKKAYDYRLDASRRGFSQIQRSLVAKILHFLGGRSSYEIELLSDYWKWYEIWICAIGIPIWFRVSKDTGAEFPNEIKKLVGKPEDPIYLILDELTSSKKKIVGCNAVAREVRSFLSTVPNQYAIFIDNTDEGLQHLVGIDSRVPVNAPNAAKQTPTIWIAAQLGLLEVAREFKNDYPRIRLFATIRKEAYDKYPGHTGSVLPDLCCMLHYEKEDVRTIFENNIRLVPNEDLVLSLGRNEPIEALLGATTWDHWRAKDETGNSVKEPLFDAFYRHTLGRPRDLMIVGEKICRIQPPARRTDTDNLRKVAREASDDIFNDYKKECVPYWDERYEEVFARVSSAIVRRKDAVRVAKNFQTKHTDLDNPLLFFAKRGLLGFVTIDHTKKPVQQFLVPGMSEIDFKLPLSPLYFFHPILGHKLDQNSHPRAITGGTELEKRIIVGNGMTIPSDIYKEVMLEEGELKLALTGTGDPALAWDDQPIEKFSSAFQSHTIFVFGCLIGFAVKAEDRLTLAEFLKVIHCCDKEGLFGDRSAEVRSTPHAHHIAQSEYFTKRFKETDKPDFIRATSQGFKEFLKQSLISYSKKTQSLALNFITHTQIVIDPQLKPLLKKVRTSIETSKTPTINSNNQGGSKTA